MEFGLSELQLSLQDSVLKYLDDACTLETVREIATNPDSDSSQLWKGLAELGVAGLIVPEEFGGVGLNILDAVAISECLGNRVAPVPFLETSVLAAYALVAAGSERQKADHLGQIANGSLTIGLAISELAGARGDAGISCDGDRLNGKAMFVSNPDAELLLIADRERRLYLINANADGLTMKPMPQVDRTRKLVVVELNGVQASLLPLSEDAEISHKLVDIGRVVLAADTLGASQSMLDQAVAYAMERVQFDRVIASFQAVKHMCAEMAAEIEPARSLLWYAGYALDEIPEEARLTACHTKAHLSEVGTFVARTATVVHGGMGFTDLLGLHYWFKRIGFNRQFLGGPEKVREEAVAVQGLLSA